jgi:hypothetical protein
MYIDKRKRKKEKNLIDRENDKILIEKYRLEMELEKERIKKKKDEKREIFLELLKENDKKIEQKKNQKEIENINGRKYVIEYEELLEKREKERERVGNNSKVIKNNPDNDNDLKIQQEKQEEINSYHDRYLKEKCEIEDK